MGNLLKQYAGTHYHYDGFGNLQRRITPNGEAWHYHYDPEHRLIEASHYARAPAAGDQATPLSQARYGYDGLGRRVWKQVEHQGQPPELTVFSWDGDLLQSEERFQGRLPVVYGTAQPLQLTLEKPERKLSTPVAQRVHSLGTAAMVPQRRVSYLFEPDSFIPAAKLEADYQAIPQATGNGSVLYTEHRPTEPQLYYFQTDHLGTPLEVTDTHGKLAWVGHYRAWGKLDKARDGNGNPAATDNPFRFQGQYHDEETGLHYNRHRYYDPEIGRFTTQDPIGLRGGENLYQYAPNPTGWVDPLGLASSGVPQIKPGSAEGATSGQAFPRNIRDAAKAENPTATCVYCRQEGTANQVDHAIPKARGGNATLDNAQLACRHCNASKGARDFPKTPPPGYVGSWPPDHW